MYKISYEKCVCFIFLVILAVLSCSGFRIDNLAMTDISKKNSYTSSNSLLLNSDSEFLNRLFNIDNSLQNSAETTTRTPPVIFRHKLRHHRQLRAEQVHNFRAQHEPNRPPTGWIDTLVLPPLIGGSTPTSTQPNEQFAQIPATDLHPLLPTKSIIVRLQRSNDYKTNRQRNNNNRKTYPCQEQDISRKSYLANTIVLAKAESISSNRKENYWVLFKIIQRIKNTSFPVDERIRIKFSSDKIYGNCEQSFDETNRANLLVKAKIEQSKEYVLFLKTYGAHNYSIVGTPELSRRRKIPNSVFRISNTTFRPKPAKVEKLEKAQSSAESRKRLKLVCKVKGFPVPYIIWKRNGTLLHSNSHVRITYKNDGKDRRKSTLVIKNPRASDWGQYECTARGVDGSTASKLIRVELERRATSSHTPTSIRPSTNILSEKSPSGEPCDDNMKNVYCNNGGTCFYEPTMEEYGCLCAEGYSGTRCEEKLSNQSSMYGQNPRYTCNIGLYTKYDNC